MRLAILAAAAALSGCATTGIEVAYHSDPPGATLYQDGKAWGTTPAVLTYAVDPAFKAGGCFKTKATAVKWASGAQASIAYLSVCASKGYSQQYTFMRPNVAGRDVDLNYALQLQRNEILQRQADAVEDAAWMQMLQQQQGTSCSSYRVGSSIETRCR
jgi:hypothetical protein